MRNISLAILGVILSGSGKLTVTEKVFRIYFSDTHEQAAPEIVGTVRLFGKEYEIDQESNMIRLESKEFDDMIVDWDENTNALEVRLETQTEFQPWKSETKGEEDE